MPNAGRYPRKPDARVVISLTAIGGRAGWIQSCRDPPAGCLPIHVKVSSAFSRLSLRLHRKPMQMPLKARLYWLAAMAAGVLVIVWAGISWNVRQENLPKAALYLVAAVVASNWKIRLPGVIGTLSMSSLFIIAGLLELELESAVLIGVSSVLTQILFRPKIAPAWEQVVFTALSMPVPVFAASRVIVLPFLANIDPTGILAPISASMVYYLV